jgi:hypothetical protein
MAQGLRFAGIAAPGGGFINLVNGLPTVATGGALTTSVAPGIGHAVNATVSTRYSAITNSYSESPSSFSFAAIVIPTGFTNGFLDTIFSTNATSQSAGYQFGLFNLQPSIKINGGNNLFTGLTLTVNVPYFIAVSLRSTKIWFVATNLVTGKIYTASGSSATIGSVATPWSVGSSIGSCQPNCKIAAVAYSVNNFMALSQLQAWAAAPWDYWYPPTLGAIISLVGTSAKAPVDLAGNLGAPSYYGKRSYGLGHYSRIDAFAPVFSAAITVVAALNLAGGLTPTLVLAADLDVHVNLIELRGDLAPQIVLEGALSLDLPLTALEGSFGFSVVYRASSFISGPLWADAEPCPSPPWAESEPCPPPAWMTAPPCDPVVWSKTRLCNG